jgi:cytochrome c553
MIGCFNAWLLKPLARTVILLTLVSVHTPKLLADEPSAHPQANVSMCRGCHGIADYRTAFPEVYSVPKLGGQQAAYIVKALQDYKQGLRTHATMRSIAALLTDEQMTAIAAYYAGNGQ